MKPMMGLSLPRIWFRSLPPTLRTMGYRTAPKTGPGKSVKSSITQLRIKMRDGVEIWYAGAIWVLGNPGFLRIVNIHFRWNLRWRFKFVQLGRRPIWRTASKLDII